MILFLALCAGLLVCSLSLVVYRLFFHPLAGFPGPRLTAATGWYETYFDLVKDKGGTFMYEVDRMHAIYGPIVRINPDELHVKDPEWVEVLYASPSNGIRNKYWPAAMATGMPGGIFGTVNHDVHRSRRAAIDSLFSKTSVKSFEPVLQEMVGRLSSVFLTASLENRPLELGSEYLALTTDAVCEHALGRNRDLLDNQHRTRDWKKTVRAVAGLTPFAKQFPWLIPTAFGLRLPLLRSIAPNLSKIVELQRYMNEEAIAATLPPPLSDTDHVRKPRRCPPGLTTGQRNTVFQKCLASRSLAAGDKRVDRLAEEAFTIVVAGGEATARVLATASFHIVANKHRVLSRLRLELEAAFPDPDTELDLKTLEKLPWLTAVIKESLRISTLVVSRLPLVAPCDALRYKQWWIPPGTPVSMSLRDVLLDESIYEQPLEFLPERWLAADDNHSRRARFHLPFGRGSRMCIGLNLAMAELYVVLGSMFRRFDFDLYYTTRERDVDVVRDCFVGEPRMDSVGVRVKVRPVPQFSNVHEAGSAAVM